MKAFNLSITSRTALFLSVYALLAGYFINTNVFEKLPHLEDEWTYIWQAKVMARGQMIIPTPPNAGAVFVPFVVDDQGNRFGKYPPGWPTVLALGVIFGATDLVNPILGGLGVWLTYRLGSKLFDKRLGLVAAFLTVTSPFYLITSGSYLSHSWSYLLTICLAIAWLDAFPLDTGPKITAPDKDILPWMPVALAGLSLGTLVITRPLTAVGVAIPFFIHGLILLIRGNQQVRLKVLAIGAIGVAVGSILFLWQYKMTGEPLLNPYTLWWEYDKIGFGVGYGTVPSGHSLKIGIDTAKTSLNAGWKDLFGWSKYSWLLLPIGYWAIRKNRAAWLIGFIYWMLVAVYLAYWVGSWVYGPRYYYEGLFSITLLSAAAIGWMAGWHLPDQQREGWQRFRSPAVIVIAAILVGYNLFVYLPARLGELRGVYGINRSMIAPILAPETQQFAPAVVMIHTTEKNGWRDYAAFLTLEDPWMTTPFIFALSINPQWDIDIEATYPDRNIIHYYMDGKLNITRRIPSTP